MLRQIIYIWIDALQMMSTPVENYLIMVGFVLRWIIFRLYCAHGEVKISVPLDGNCNYLEILTAIIAQNSYSCSTDPRDVG